MKLTIRNNKNIQQQIQKHWLAQSGNFYICILVCWLIMDKMLLYEGQRFASFLDWNEKWKNYKENVREAWSIRTSVNFKESDGEYAYKTLQTKYILYICIFGQKRASKSTGLRKSRTCKENCTAKIAIRANKEREYLEIVKLEEKHSHDYKKYYEYIAPNRKLTKAEENEVLRLKAMKCPTKSITHDIQKRTGKKIVTKTINNLVQKSRRRGDDTLSVLLQLLHSRGAECHLAHQNGNFKGLFFCTERMKQDMLNFPEIIFTDGTYKLFKRNLVLQVMSVEDSHTASQIVGIGILADEQGPTLKWLFQVFKKCHPEASIEIACFMTDKDLTARGVIKEVFPNVELLLCSFHVLKAMKAALDKMKLTAQQKDISATILDKLVKSETEREYDYQYQNLHDLAPRQVVSYFDINWHPIKCQWSHYAMFNSNLGNTTNNRSESMNEKLKAFMNPKDELVPSVNNLFKAMEHRDLQNNFRRVQDILRKDRRVLDIDSDQSKYRYALTREIFEKVLKQIELSEKVVFKEKNMKEKQFQVFSKQQVQHVTEKSCTCNLWNGSQIPCRHIFAVRALCNIPLFEEALCGRWRKEEQLRPNVGGSSDKNLNVQSIEVSQIILPKKLTEKQKESSLKPLLNNLLQLASQCDLATYKKRYKTLQTIQAKWSVNVEIEILNDSQAVDSSVPDITSSFAELSIHDEEITPKTSGDDESCIDGVILPDTEMKYDKIKMPPAAKITSRSRRSTHCTIQRTKRRSLKKKKK